MSTSSFGRYLLLEQALPGGLINALINAAIAWASVDPNRLVPFWGESGLFWDFLITSVVIAPLVTLIVAGIERAKIKKQGGVAFSLEQSASVLTGLSLPSLVAANLLIAVGMCSVILVWVAMSLAEPYSAPVLVGFKTVMAAGIGAVCQALTAATVCLSFTVKQTVQP